MRLHYCRGRRLICQVDRYAIGTAFLQLDAPDGIVDVILPEDLYLKFHDAFHSAFLVVEGVLRQQQPTVSVLMKKVTALE